MNTTFPTISLCMIAKDEEQFIEQAISSVQGAVSEIIVADTGSTDGTIEIAKKLGARVYSFTWNDDFSPPRNFSLGKAKSDWILVLDADEIIAASDLGELRELTLDPTACWKFTQRHYSNDQRMSNFCPVAGEYPECERNFGGYFESGLVRLFPNNEGIEYRGRIHELVEHSIKDIGRHEIKVTNIPIHHYGHIKSVKRERDKSKLYTPLGKEKVSDMPADWKSHMELGVEHSNGNRFAEAVEAFYSAAELNSGYVPLWINLGYALCCLKRYQEAEESLKKAIKIDGKSFEAYGNLGLVYLRTENYLLAEKCFRAAIAINQTFINGYCNLGTVFLRTKRLSEAANIFLRVLDIMPQCTTAKSDLGSTYLSAGMYMEAEKYLRAALDDDAERSADLYNLALLCKETDRKQEATSLLNAAFEIEKAKASSGFISIIEKSLQEL